MKQTFPLIKKLALCVFLILFTAPTIYAEAIFFDDFESGHMDTTNNGFAWLNLSRTSIVTQSETDGNVIIFSSRRDGQVYDIQNDGKDWTAFDGNNSLRFRYPAGEPWAEQRFELGEAYPELWISFWLRAQKGSSLV